jgi:hypothetical protein
MPCSQSTHPCSDRERNPQSNRCSTRPQCHVLASTAGRRGQAPSGPERSGRQGQADRPLGAHPSGRSGRHQRCSPKSHSEARGLRAPRQFRQQPRNVGDRAEPYARKFRGRPPTMLARPDPALSGRPHGLPSQQFSTRARPIPEDAPVITTAGRPVSGHAIWPTTEESPETIAQLHLTTGASM